MGVWRWKPDMTDWRKVARSTYESNDGLCRVEKRNFHWAAMNRDDVDSTWRELGCYLTLTVAQYECRRQLTKGG